MKTLAYMVSVAALLVSSPSASMAQNGLLKFDRNVIDAGTMTEDDAPRTYTFTGRNVSRRTLHITQVKTTCGCTSSTVSSK